MESEKIEIYKERSFGGRLSATLAFLRGNSKPIIRYSLIFLLPIVLIYNFLFCISTGQVLKSLEVSYLTSTAFWLLIGWLMFGMLLFLSSFSFFFALIKLYHERPEGLDGIRFGDIYKVVRVNFMKMSFILLYVIIISFMIFSLNILFGSMITLIVCAISFFVLGIPWLYIVPVYLMEKISIWKAAAKSLQLGYKSYGGVLGMGFLLFFDLIVLSLFFAFPYLIFLSVESTFFNSSDTFAVPVSYQIFDYLFSLLMVSGSVISMIILHVGMTYQYGHASVHKDNKMVVDNIDQAMESFKVIRED